MKSLVLLPLVVLLLVPIQVYADHASIVTDKSSYNRGDPIHVTGTISEYVTSPVSAEIVIIDPTGNSILDKKFITDVTGKIEAYLLTDNWTMSGTYEVFCTNCDHGIYFSFNADVVSPTNPIQHVDSTASQSQLTKQTILPMSTQSLTNLYTKLDILKNNGGITNDDIVKVTNYLVSQGYTDEATLSGIILKAANSSEVVRNTPTFTTEIHSCTHMDYAPTVYMEGFITNNMDVPHTVIFRFEILDKNNTLLNYKESDMHQMGPYTEWDGADYVQYDPMFDHCDIHVEQIK